jgi:SAM-dependent methyltransferase
MGILESHWESIHTEKFKDVSWWQNEDALWLDLFENENLSLSASIIDVGSGASLLIDRLHSRGYTDLSVLDISEAALARLRSEVVQGRYEVHYYCANVLHFTADRSFDVWHDRAVFHFLTEPSEQTAYVDSVRRNLKAGGLLIVATFAPDGPDRCSNLPIAKHDANSLQLIFGKEFRLIHSENRVHETPWGSKQSFTVAKFRLTASLN